MTQSKYHTIDPLILETLNLNERRMNHILDILHGRPERKYPATERKSINRTHLKDNSSATLDVDESLPPILLNRRRVKPSPTLERMEPKSYRKIQQNKSSDRLITNQSRSLRKIAQKDDPSPQIKNSNQKREEVKRKASQRANTIEVINWQEENMRLQEEKKQQLMNDYMMGKLKRSKSQQINPKDVYRMQIEELVAQLTPIQQLQDVEKKMQRLKRRTKHLHTFDKNYYSKLNQHDLVVLS